MLYLYLALLVGRVIVYLLLIPALIGTILLFTYLCRLVRDDLRYRLSDGEYYNDENNN